MRIGVLTSNLPGSSTGGAEIQARILAERLAASHDVHVLTRSAPPETPTPYRVVQRCGIRMRGVRFLADVTGAQRAVGRLRDSLDVLVAYQTVIDGFLAVRAKRRYGIPAVVSVRSEREYAFERVPSIRWLAPYVLRHADLVIVQAPTIRLDLLAALEDAGHADLSGIVADKTRVVPNGIEPRGGEPTAGGETILYVGRLIEAKGVHVLVEAMRACPSEELVIVGDGPERAQLEAAAAGMSHVRFVGRVAHGDLEEHYRRAKLLVMPSIRDEGMPNAIMEAMNRGLPVVATADAGIPDLVRDGETGLVVAPGDSAALGEAIRSLGADAGRRERFGTASLAAIRDYDWRGVVAETERLLAEVVATAKRAASPAGS